MVGALFIVSNQTLYLQESEDMSQFITLYQSWLSNIFDNALEITGYVTRSEWLPQSQGDIKLSP